MSCDKQDTCPLCPVLDVYGLNKVRSEQVKITNNIR